MKHWLCFFVLCFKFDGTTLQWSLFSILSNTIIFGNIYLLLCQKWKYIIIIIWWATCARQYSDSTAVCPRHSWHCLFSGESYCSVSAGFFKFARYMWGLEFRGGWTAWSCSDRWHKCLISCYIYFYVYI